MTSDKFLLLVMMVPEQMKDKMVDTLIAQPALSGFSLSKIQGFSAQNSHFNINEQVEGYKALYRFEILLDRSDVEELIEHVKKLCSGVKLRYWVTPVLYAG
jgi:nitrogen regulatory protein PII